MANSQLNTNDASVAQLQTARFEHGPALLIAPDMIERYGENFDLQTGSNFRSL